TTSRARSSVAQPARSAASTKAGQRSGVRSMIIVGRKRRDAGLKIGGIADSCRGPGGDFTRAAPCRPLSYRPVRRRTALSEPMPARLLPRRPRRLAAGLAVLLAVAG